MVLIKTFPIRPHLFWFWSNVFMWINKKGAKLFLCSPAGSRPSVPTVTRPCWCPPPSWSETRRAKFSCTARLVVWSRPDRPSMVSLVRCYECSKWRFGFSILKVAAFVFIVLVFVGTPFPCSLCNVTAVPQYHLAMVDGTIRNFCSYTCVSTFRVSHILKIQSSYLNICFLFFKL